MVSQMESGAVSVNQQTLPSSAVSFGGIKNSGYSCEFVPNGIKKFANRKYNNSVSIDLTVFGK